MSNPHHLRWKGKQHKNILDLPIVHHPIRNRMQNFNLHLKLLWDLIMAYYQQGHGTIGL